MATRRVEKPGTIDALDIAMHKARDSDQARDLLEKQARLIDSQEVLAQADLTHRRWQIISERIGATLKGLTVLAGLLILVGIGAFLWSAHQASGMVVDPFAVPPDMDRNGLTGTVLASELLDKVSTLEAQTQSARAQSSYENSWSDSKGVEVPYTGVSLGELRRQARDWLGSENHLSGEVVRLPNGNVAVSFRTTDKASGEVQGKEADLDSVLNNAALQIFKATQPYRYSVYQQRRGNVAEAVATLTQLSRSNSLQERLWAMHGLALNAANERQSTAIYERVLKLKPDFLPAIGNLAIYALDEGHEEAALHAFQRSAAAYAKGEDDYTRDYSDAFGLDAKGALLELEGDPAQAAATFEEAQDHGGGGPVIDADRPFVTALAYAHDHDVTGARRALEQAGYLDPAKFAAAVALDGPQLDPHALYAIATNDLPTIADAYSKLLLALDATADDAQFDERTGQKVATDGIRVNLAPRLARLGRIAEASRIIAPVASDDDEALRARGLIEAYAGHRAASDALFREEVARTPSLSAGHLAWAEAAFVTGRPQLAAEQAKLANEKSPRLADALKLWGDALNAQNRVSEAQSKYAEAAQLAPRWGRLRIDRANSLWRLHRRTDAIAEMREAAAMALSPADRALLQHMWQAARAKIG